MPQRPVEDLPDIKIIASRIVDDYRKFPPVQRDQAARSMIAAALAAEREQFREASVLVDLEGESVGWAPVHAIPLLAKALRDAVEDTKWPDWQPIETAPSNLVAVIYEPPAAIVVAWRIETPGNYGWTDGTTKGIHDEPVAYYPTHWMPLPAPPAIDTAATPTSEVEK